MQQQIIFHRKSISRNITHPQPYKSYYNIYLNKIVGLKQQKMLGENLIDWETQTDKSSRSQKAFLAIVPCAGKRLLKIVADQLLNKIY